MNENVYLLSEINDLRKECHSLAQLIQVSKMQIAKNEYGDFDVDMSDD
jgi:hypothetical protein